MPDRIDPQAQWYNTEIDNKTSQPTLGQSQSMQVKTGQIITRKFGPSSLRPFANTLNSLIQGFTDNSGSYIQNNTGCGVGCQNVMFGVDLSYLPIGSRITSYRMSYAVSAGQIQIDIFSAPDVSLGGPLSLFNKIYSVATPGFVIDATNIPPSAGCDVRSDAYLTFRVQMATTVNASLFLAWVEVSASVPGLTY